MFGRVLLYHLGSLFKICFRSFSQTIFEKLCVTFLSPFASPSKKISLVGVFANMQADVEMTMKVFALGNRILQEACNQQLMLPLINSLTTLAASCRFPVSELVNYFTHAILYRMEVILKMELLRDWNISREPEIKAMRGLESPAVFRKFWGFNTRLGHSFL